ncbi:MAG: nucleotidyl transferase AbiEii/AbiGii toxin family protein [Candidatus Omnitrophica bacterium]|nr:nucleotidyl transferase AbiEii/AbiGii toxin family protein [Candidatus Omnitrophota bacterium]
MEGTEMISRAELQRLANREKVALGTLEKDYVITEVLKALSLVPALSELLVFKGGTALRKVYFPDWRYSEDLDFTVKHDMTKEELRQDLDQWYQQVRLVSEIQLTTKMLHKPDGYARVRTQFIGPLSYPGMIFMDLSFDEPLCLDPERRRVLATPFSSGEQEVLAYPLEELLAEKMRSLLERGKSRDYYDVWRLLKEHSSTLDLELLSTVLPKKLSHKNLNVTAVDDFLPRDIKGLKRYWEKDLGQQIVSLPSLEEVIEELRDMLDKLVFPHIAFPLDDAK